MRIATLCSATLQTFLAEAADRAGLECEFVALDPSLTENPAPAHWDLCVLESDSDQGASHKHLRALLELDPEIDILVLVPDARTAKSFWQMGVRDVATQNPAELELALARFVANRARYRLNPSERWLIETQRCRLMAAVAPSVSHEVNNPLAAIINYAALLQRQADTQISEIGTVIRTQSQAISATIQNMAAFARLEGDDHPPAIVQATWKEVTALMRPRFMRSQIELKESFAEDLPAVVIGRTELQQVLLNMVLNGLTSLNNRYPGPHPDKVLEVCGDLHKSETGNFVRISVRDSGHGLSQQQCERAFEWRVSSGQNGDRSQLGLYASRALVRARGGQMSIESLADGYLRIHADLLTASS